MNETIKCDTKMETEAWATAGLMGVITIISELLPFLKTASNGLVHCLVNRCKTKKAVRNEPEENI